MSKFLAARLALSALLVLALAACSNGHSNAAPAPVTTTTVRARNLGEAVAYSPHLSTFATALNASGVLGTLTRGGGFTVFAPDDTAIARLPHPTLAALLSPAERKRLARFVRAHVVKGSIGPAALHAGLLHTLNGTTLTIVKSANGYTVSDGHGHTAAVELPPRVAPNAVVYPIDSVIASA
jgi:uncharacterized surface protein with fasciclin (FAS1) repeats